MKVLNEKKRQLLLRHPTGKIVFAEPESFTYADPSLEAWLRPFQKPLGIKLLKDDNAETMLKESRTYAEYKAANQAAVADPAEKEDDTPALVPEVSKTDEPKSKEEELPTSEVPGSDVDPQTQDKANEASDEIHDDVSESVNEAAENDAQSEQTGGEKAEEEPSPQPTVSRRTRRSRQSK